MFLQTKFENKFCSSETISRLFVSQWKSTGFGCWFCCTSKTATVSLTGEQSSNIMQWCWCTQETTRVPSIEEKIKLSSGVCRPVSVVRCLSSGVCRPCVRNSYLSKSATNQWRPKYGNIKSNIVNIIIRNMEWYVKYWAVLLTLYCTQYGMIC